MKIVKIARNGERVEVIVEDRNVFQKKIFPLTMTDEQVKSVLAGEKIEEKSVPVPEIPEVKEDAKKEPPKKSDEVCEDKRTLKAKYLRELKEKGIDTTGLIKFSDVEKVYNLNMKGGK